MHMAPSFTYGHREGQNIGGFAVQVPKKGYDSNVITYTTHIDDDANKITITPKQEAQFTTVDDQNKTAEVISDDKSDQIIAALDERGLVSDKTLRLFVDDIAEKMGISSDMVWRKMIEAREIDRQIIGFDPDSGDDGLTF